MFYGGSGPRVSEIHLNRCVASCFCRVLKVWESGVLGMHLRWQQWHGRYATGSHSDVVISQIA